MIAHGTDGVDSNVTADATWQSADPEVVTVAGGLARGVKTGDTSISASFRGYTKTLAVRVIPDGTFRVQGLVTDARTGVGLWGAVILATTGPSAGIGAGTDVRGSYRLYGVAGDVTISVMRPGYRQRFERIVIGADQTLPFQLDGTGPSPQIDGNYRLTITASASCSGLLPMDLRMRSYAAEIRSSGTASFLGLLSDAEFQPDPQNPASGKFNTFEANTLADGGVAVDFRDFYGDPAVVERVGGNLLSVAAWGVAHFDESRTSGFLNGNISFQTMTTTTPTRYVECQAADHRFELVRQ